MAGDGGDKQERGKAPSSGACSVREDLLLPVSAVALLTSMWLFSLLSLRFMQHAQLAHLTCRGTDPCQGPSPVSADAAKHGCTLRLTLSKFGWIACSYRKSRQGVPRWLDGWMVIALSCPPKLHTRDETRTQRSTQNQRAPRAGKSAGSSAEQQQTTNGGVY